MHQQKTIPIIFSDPMSPDKFQTRREDLKTPKDKLKTQAARFRIYGYDSDGNVVKEITAADASIQWRVHIANRKAGWYMFNNALDLVGAAIPSSFRNADVTDRSQLIIDPGKIAISGTQQRGEQYRFDKGSFMGIPVPLGELRTDSEGRLIVLGGDGHSASYTNEQAITFANNDTWHDDISDGPVWATVTLKDGTVLEADPGHGGCYSTQFRTRIVWRGEHVRCCLQYECGTRLGDKTGNPRFLGAHLSYFRPNDANTMGESWFFHDLRSKFSGRFHKS